MLANEDSLEDGEVPGSVRGQAPEPSPDSNPGSNMSSRTCELCGKTFSKDSTHKRHHYYCRAKQSQPAVSKTRSCASCIRAKTRCVGASGDVRQPCTRCKERGIPCVMNNSVTRRRLAPVHPPTTTDSTRSAERQPSSVLVETAVASTKSSSLPLADWLFDPSLLDLELEPLGSGEIYSNDPLLMFPTTPTLSRPLQPVFTNSMTLRPLSNGSQKPMRTLLLRILRSYPFMLLRKETFPPFVSPLLFSMAEAGDGPPQQSLINCVSLVQMFQSRTQANRSFIWRLIRLEQERIRAEVDETSVDRWELLASFQALLIYTLLCLLDQESRDRGFDVPLLSTVNLVGTALSCSVGGMHVIELPDDPSLVWRDWSFNECRRRTILVYRVINIVVDLSVAVSCRPMNGFVLVPLASNATMWEADNLDVWNSERKLSFEERTIYGLSDAGNLVKLRQDESGIQASLAVWEEWSSSIGELGSLVMIAGALVEAAVS